MFRLKGRALRFRVVASVCISCITAGVLTSGSVVTAQAEKGPAARVMIYADGAQWEYVTRRQSVKDVLRETGINLGAKDRVIPTSASKVKQGTKITVVRITEDVSVTNTPIRFKTRTRFDNGSDFQGKTVIRKGEPGIRRAKAIVVYKDGVKRWSKALTSQVIKYPVNEVIAISKSRFLASRAGMRLPSLRMIATAYDPGPRSCGPRATGHTAMGLHAGFGIVAVDPRIIPLGTKLYVEGYGFCLAGDTGGAIKGSRIDLGFDSYHQAKSYGRHPVTVYVIN